MSSSKIDRADLLKELTLAQQEAQDWKTAYETLVSDNQHALDEERIIYQTKVKNDYV